MYGKDKKSVKMFLISRSFRSNGCIAACKLKIAVYYTIHSTVVYFKITLSCQKMPVLAYETVVNLCFVLPLALNTGEFVVCPWYWEHESLVYKLFQTHSTRLFCLIRKTN